jgi:hypothetical protein
MGAMRAEDLDDRADVADFAIVPVVGFEGLHLLGDDVAHLALVESHPTVPFSECGFVYSQTTVAPRMSM